MNENEAFEEIRSVTAEYLGVDKENIFPETSFMNNLGADSLDAIELRLAFEDRFDVEISKMDEKKLGTVGGMAGFLLQNKNGSKAILNKKGGIRL